MGCVMADMHLGVVSGVGAARNGAELVLGQEKSSISKNSTSDEMKLLKPVNLIIADPDRDVAATAADLETPLVSRTSCCALVTIQTATNS